MKQFIDRPWKTFFISLCLIISPLAYADEGGVSFWVPGFFGSLAAAPLQPGFSLTSIYYHTTVTGGSELALARQITTSRMKLNFTGNRENHLTAKSDSFFAIPSYTFAHSFLNGQATLALGIPYSQSQAHVNSTLSGNFGLGNGFTVGKARSDEVTGFGDLVPLMSVRWHNGDHNFLTYFTSNLTVGVYNPNNLTNLGLNHNSLDAGAGYTFFNQQSGYECSAVLGVTYNAPNTATQYQNGVDMHIDTSLSRFFNKEVQLGLVGYAYTQLSCDSGPGDQVGCFNSRTFGAGPQLGYTISGNNHQTYINVKGYKEFNAMNRAAGWNTWLTLSLSPK